MQFATVGGMNRPPPAPTADEWARWLADAERRLLEVYRLSPERLVAEYRREREITRGYHGREILELLQNAGDAAHQAEVRGRVRIVVDPLGMVVGNTGLPFDEGGMMSLQTANLSPKREREAVVIGDKGLGFRSILNWTRSPLISSGRLNVAFLPAYAASMLQRLEQRSEHVARLVTKEREISGELVVPRLAFPQPIEDWAGHSWPEEDGIRAVAMTCQALRSEGFNTAVGMPFASPRAYNEVVAQLDELQPEFLLLVDSIGELEIQVSGRRPLAWARDSIGAWRVIREGDQELSRWTVTSFDDELPSELVDADQHKRRFRVTLAISANRHAGSGRLYCYFPTDVELPLPLLAHATVELDETRKHLNDTRANRYIVSVLATHVADLAAASLAGAGEDRWRGCRLVTPAGAWGGELLRFGFADSLKTAARKRKLIPVLEGGHRMATEAKWAPGEETRWWPRRIFPEITAYASADERKLAQHLDVERLEPAEIVRRTLSVNDLTIEERANVIAGLLRAKDLVGYDLTGLLCDETGTPLSADTAAIFQPVGELPGIPRWARLRFLHPELRERLGRLLNTSDVRELQQRLRPFGVIEYSLTALIRPVLAEAARRVKDSPESAPETRSDAIHFLWGIFQNHGEASSFPLETSLRLPSQNGDWVAPQELYLGEGYGKEGNVTQDLYGAWAPMKVLERPPALGLGESSSRLIAFLHWLGVRRWPRLVAVQQIPEKFLSEARDGLHYPVEFEDCKFQSPDELTGMFAADFHSVDSLDGILKHAPPEAVLAWLTLDTRSVQWSRALPEHGKLKVWPAYKQYARSYHGPVPSLVHWQISTASWLPAVDGTKRAPRHCLFGDRQLETLFPQPAQPALTLQERYGITDRFFECYIRAGVMPGLAQVGRDELYRLLLEAPNASPDGNASRALCRWLLSHEAALLGFEGEYQKRFFREGRLWGKKADRVGFWGVRELRHVDFEGLPTALLRNIPIADLPKRAGPQKVREILGVSPLEKTAIRQQLVSHRVCPRHEEWSRWFIDARPALKGLRQAQTKQAQSVSAIERMTLIVCDELRVRLQYEGASEEHQATDGEWFIFDEFLYVRGDLDDSIDLLADATGMAVASVFGIADGDAFSKVLRCESKNRGKLLKRMCGDDFQQVVENGLVLPRPTYSGPVEPPPTPNGADAESKVGAESNSDDSKHGEPVNGRDSATKTQPGIRRLPHEPLPPKTSRSLVIKNVQRNAAAPRGPRQAVDWKLCEEMAVAFEAQNAPPRFALGVGHIMGTDAPGFDLISFATAEEREAFKNSVTRDWGRVLRFIEVKGRSSSTATIDLKGNELRAARNYGDRYFLYRFFQQGDGHYFVSVLQNPMGAGNAITAAVEVDLDRAQATQRFDFVAEMEE